MPDDVLPRGPYSWREVLELVGFALVMVYVFVGPVFLVSMWTFRRWQPTPMVWWEWFIALALWPIGFAYLVYSWWVLAPPLPPPPDDRHILHDQWTDRLKR